MASIARRTLMNLFDCIRCFLRGIEASAWLPLNFHTDHRYGDFPTKSVIQNQIIDWEDVQVQRTTAKMLLNITQTVQEMQQRATVALITASLTAPVGSILLTAPTRTTVRTDNKTIDTVTKRPSLPGITCSFIDSTPSYCYFIINGSEFGIRKSISRAFNEKLRNTKANTECDADNDANNNSFNDDDIASTLDSSSVMLPRQRTFSESSDDNFICFVDDEDDDLDCKANSGSSKNYGYYSNQYDSETDCSSDDSCDEEEEDENENEDCGILSDKKVRFDLHPKVHVMRTWNFAYRSARKGEWESMARDRFRFQNRIKGAATYLDRVLDPQHRQKIYETRFEPTNQHRNKQEPNQFDKPF